MAKGMMPLQEEKAAFEEGLLKEIGDSMEIGHGDKNGGDNNPEVVQQMECNQEVEFLTWRTNDVDV